VDRAYCDFHRDVQFRHWWFVGRSRIVEAFLEKPDGLRRWEILDIGSGFGSLVPTLKRWGDVDALEPLEEAHVQLREFGVRRIFDFAFPPQVPDQRYDMVTLFDVLEHIENDDLAVSIIRQDLLQPGGRLILTVPAHSWLWSRHDELNRHYRRYSSRGLEALLRRAGFQEIRSSHFMCLLFPLAIVDRISSRFRSSPGTHIAVPRQPFNGLLRSVFAMESRIVSRIRLPFGLSLVMEGRG
jgi:SAM-dependent methyltransferase